MSCDNFWSVIEEDLSINIPNYIKNGFEICGFGNPYSFKNISDIEIDAVEKYMREKLNDIPNLLVAISSNEELFGKLFSKNSKLFEFMIGERLLIKELVEHVKGIMDHTGAHYFQQTVTSHSTMVSNTPKPVFEKRSDDTRTHFFLGKLISAANKNSERKKGGYRYDQEIKRYAAYLRMISGPLAYETIQKNLEHSLPSLSSTNRYIESANCHIVEGVLRNEELLLYLKERNLPLVVVLSEDATRIEGRVQYDPVTNQIVGFTLPTNHKNGMPIPYFYPARTAEEICRHFSNKNGVSNFLNIIMAQPVEAANPFCLLAFGSNNRYTASDVSKRWKYIENELSKIGIKVLSVSSDSDPRYNSAMREHSQLSARNETHISWFACNESTGPFYVQDIVHIGTKLRNFLLRTIWNERKFPFGTYYINWNHLHFLLCNFSKGEHQLTATVLNPIDRQNFISVLRMCHPRVINLLIQHVRDSEATVVFLNMMRDVIESFLDHNIAPLERVRKTWYPIFIIRIWRQFIKSHKQYTLKDNFLTSNCYSCLELNAHSLVLCMLYLQKINRPDWFLPYLFESQPCESMFRQFRSFTSTYSTVTNCTVKDAISRISKIQLQNEIIHETSPCFVYPRLGRKEQFSNDNSTNKNISLPTRNEIIDEIEKCKREAIVTAHELGFLANRRQTNFTCKIPFYAPNVRIQIRGKKLNYNSFVMPNIQNIQLKNFVGKINKNITPHCPYVEVITDNGEVGVYKKMSLCWLWGRERHKMSSDRLKRVQYKDYDSKPTKKKKRANTFSVYKSKTMNVRKK